MFCANCGKEIVGDGKFCAYCGSAIGTNTTQAAAASPKTEKRELRCVIKHKAGTAEVYNDCIVIKKKGEFWSLRAASEKKYLFSQIKAIEKHRKQFMMGAFIHFDMGEGRSSDGGILFDYAIEFKNNEELDVAYEQIEREYNRFNDL